MENEGKAVTKKNKTLFIKGYAITHVCLYIACMLCYYFGVTAYYGKRVDLYGAIDMLFWIFELDSIFYQNVGGIAIGVLDIVFFIRLAKGFKEVLEYAKLCLGKSEQKDGNEEESEETRWRYLLRLNGAFGKGVTNILIFIVACGLVKTYSLPFAAIAVIVISIATYFLSRIVLYYIGEYVWKDIAFQIGYSAIFITAILAIFLCLPNAYIENMLMQIQFMFNILSVDFRAFIISVGSLVYSAISMATLIFLLKCVGKLSDCEDFQELEDFYSLEKFIYIAIALLVVEIVVVLVAGESLSPSLFLPLLKKELPLLCACIGVKLICRSSTEN